MCATLASKASKTTDMAGKWCYSPNQISDSSVHICYSDIVQYKHDIHTLSTFSRPFFPLEPAHIVEPSNVSAIINASYGEEITLTCQGEGNPAPTMAFLYLVDGIYIVEKEFTSKVEMTFVVPKSQEIFCSAINIIVDPLPCGQIQEFKEITQFIILTV